MAEVSQWMHVDHFTVDQASALWCGYDPANIGFMALYIPSEVVAAKQLLIGGIVAGTLKADSSRNGLHIIGDFSTSFVSRFNLENFARSKKLFPAFLFDTLAPFERQAKTSSKTYRHQTVPTAELPKPAPTTITNKGGRPVEYDWDSFMLEIVRRANDLDGLPDSQAELVRDMQQWFVDNFNAEPAESSIKVRISKIYKYLTDTKTKAKNPKD